MLIVSYIFVVLFTFLCVVALGAFVWIIYYSLKMVFQLSRPREAFSSRTLWNPMNVIFNPMLLSQRGLISRRRVFVGMAVFLSSLLLAATIAFVFSVALR